MKSRLLIEDISSDELMSISGGKIAYDTGYLLRATLDVTYAILTRDVKQYIMAYINITNGYKPAY